jgi:hypothetical protein
MNPALRTGLFWRARIPKYRPKVRLENPTRHSWQTVGRWPNPPSGDEALFKIVVEARKADIKRAVATACDAFDKKTWPRVTPGDGPTYPDTLINELDRAAQQNALIWNCDMAP